MSDIFAFQILPNVQCVLEQLAGRAWQERQSWEPSGPELACRLDLLPFAAEGSGRTLSAELLTLARWSAFASFLARVIAHLLVQGDQPRSNLDTASMLLNRILPHIQISASNQIWVPILIDPDLYLFNTELIWTPFRIEILTDKQSIIFW